MAFDMDLAFKITAGVAGGDAIKELRSEVDKLRTGSEKMGAGFNQLAAAAKAFIGLEVTRQFVMLGKGLLDSGEYMFQLSQKTGVATSTLTQFKAAAESSNLRIEDVADAFKKLSVSSTDALSGTGKQAAAFAALGINVTNASGQLKPLDALMYEVADAFKTSEDGAAKAAIAISLFGKKGTDLIPMLNGGSSEIKKFALVLSDDFIAGAHAFDESMDMLALSAQKFSAEVLGSILPAMNDVIHSFIEAGKIEGDDVIQKSVILTFQTLGEAIRSAAAGLTTLMNLFKQGSTAVGTIGLVLYNTAKLDFEMAGHVMDEAKERHSKYEQDLYSRLETIMRGSYIKKGITSVINALGFETSSPTEASSSSKGVGSAGGKRPLPAPNTEGLAAADDFRKFLEQQRQKNISLQQEAEFIGKTSIEVSKLKAARELDADVAQKTLKMSPQMKAEFMAQTDAIKKQRLEILQYNYDQSRTFDTGTKQAMASYVETVGDAASRAKDFWSSAFKGMENALLEFTKTGKLNFKSLAGSIIDDLIRMQIQSSITAPLAGALGGAGGVGGLLGRGFDYVSNYSTNQAISSSIAANPSFFADGGIMTSRGSVPLRKYAGGGVANSPQLAMFGEGSRPEAYVPLPDGRSIPVTMKSGGGGLTQNITIDARGADAGVEQRIRDAVKQGAAEGYALVMRDFKRGGNLARSIGTA